MAIKRKAQLDNCRALGFLRPHFERYVNLFQSKEGPGPVMPNTLFSAWQLNDAA